MPTDWSVVTWMQRWRQQSTLWRAPSSGQEHFYLETNNCCVIPLENDEFTIYSSTQAPAKHQKYVAHVLGVPAHKVVSKTKRLGGGFGGKETRSIFLHCAVAVPAHALRRPVKLSLDRDEDMQMTGQRHAFMCRYKVGHTSEGRITALDYKLYNNAGNSWDLSAAIMDRCLLHCDNVYKVDNMRVAGRLCRTNQASNTAFRGFGGPQMTVEQVARAVGRPVHEVRELNMYQEGDVTHFKQVLEVFRAPTCWKEVKASSQYEERMKQARVATNSNGVLQGYLDDRGHSVVESSALLCQMPQFDPRPAL
ncbi:uncharacterized protein HaLaN_15555 [Haematococcus lacustris]|uniref:Aldehyde oxidase/xanthine dehydrogenase first molybdopterin binding domain-containing protein n=1 Tax=Haematococcus lacustris TaxID=44745 RepID=A0A699Z7T8_HAELA|nr:uncharacterized protein HaLaN_15555 [Haematococcus lacustris]